MNLLRKYPISKRLWLIPVVATLMLLGSTPLVRTLSSKLMPS